jgi:hypothetical protein
MMRTLKMHALVALCGAAFSIAGYGQTPPATLIQVDVENNAFYNYDTFDNTKLAGNPAPTTPVAAPNFQMVLSLGDIVAVNGKPAKGVQVIRLSVLNLSPSAKPGQAISDTTAANVGDIVLDVLQPDGTRVGTILASGFGGGPAPPGAPLSAVLGNNLAITGGTGAFLGARGEIEVKSAVQGRLDFRRSRQPPQSYRRFAHLDGSPDPDVAAGDRIAAKRTGGGSQRGLFPG